jgi:hypothetical protein
MIYRGIINILESDSDFTTAIGTYTDRNSATQYKIFSVFPTIEIDAPFAGIKIDDQRGNPTKDASSAIDEIMLSIRIYDYELSDVIDIAEKARAALDKQSGTFDTTIIETLDFESLNDGFIEVEGKGLLLYRELNFEIWAVP